MARPEDLLDDIRAGHAPAIIDVRSQEEYDAGHVPGAVHLPFWTVAGRIEDIPAAHDARIVVYCQHGPRAWLAGSTLRRHGFRHVEYLRGHMHRWHRLQLPEETGTKGT
jgi:hydroxyacylglutathione hydrolase